MALWKKNLILSIIVIALAVLPLVVLKNAEFAGADGLAETAITEINPDYKPWFSSIYEPVRKKYPVSNAARLLTGFHKQIHCPAPRIEEFPECDSNENHTLREPDRNARIFLHISRTLQILQSFPIVLISRAQFHDQRAPSYDNEKILEDSHCPYTPELPELRKRKLPLPLRK